jgi:acyl carrier protein
MNAALPALMRDAIEATEPVVSPERAALVDQLRADMRRIQPRLPEAWPDAALFKADLNLDSLDLIELVARAEQHTGVLIPDADLKLMVSLDAMADYLLAQQPT